MKFIIFEKWEGPSFKTDAEQDEFIIQASSAQPASLGRFPAERLFHVAVSTPDYIATNNKLSRSSDAG